MELTTILASASPRRKKLLEDAGIKFQVRKPSQAVDESLDADMLAMPAEAAKRLAEKKAGALMQDLLAESPIGIFCVIGADTVVAKSGKVFGKPKSLDDAKRMLRELSGSEHEVITGVSVWLLLAPSEDDISLGHRTFAEASKVTFKELSDDQIAEYLKLGESFDKAGAYAIQGEGKNLVEEYEGDFDNIVGLPVARLLREFPEIKEGVAM